MSLEEDSPKRRNLVDCVAFDTAYDHTSESGGDAIKHYSICFHPQRGKQFGCLLTDDIGSESEVKRICGRRCEFRIKKGRKGSAQLEKMIAEMAEQETYI